MYPLLKMVVSGQGTRLDQPWTKSLMLPVMVLALVTGPCHGGFAAPPPDAVPQAEALSAPARNGNVWAGRDHQPSRAETEAAEKLDHETTPSAERQYDGEISEIQRRIERTEQRYPPGFLDR